jgi:hypothetical protein
VRVEPHNARIRARALKSRHDSQRCETVAGYHHQRSTSVARTAAHGRRIGDRIGDRRVQRGESRPHVTGDRLRGHDLDGPQRKVQVRQVFIEVIGNADHGHAHTITRSPHRTKVPSWLPFVLAAKGS